MRIRFYQSLGKSVGLLSKLRQNNLFSYHKLIFLRLNINPQSFGGGIDVNSIYCNVVNLLENQYSRYGSPKDNPKTFSKPQMGLNVDYNFPKELSKKWGFLRKIYNPIFSSAHFIP